MVGYAYSFEPNDGYRHIVIKAYDLPSLDFITQSSPYRIYVMDRIAETIHSIYSSDGYSGKEVTLKCLTEIIDRIILSEYDLEAPVVLPWHITESDICSFDHPNPLYTIWHIPPCIIPKDTRYINITDTCFRTLPSILHISFVCSVLNEAFYLCGIYEDDLFIRCGNSIFCREYVRGLIHKIQRNPFLRKKLLLRASRLDFSGENSYTKDNLCLVNIKRDCIRGVISQIILYLSKKQTLLRTIRQIKLCIHRSVRDIRLMSTPFLMKSGADKSSDIKYLSYEKLEDIFTFPVSHEKTRRNISSAKEMLRHMKKLSTPGAIYKGKLFYSDEKRYTL